MQGNTGFNAKTPDSLSLDSGEVFINFDVEAFLAEAQGAGVTDISTHGTRLGAIRGGAEFSSGRTTRNMEFDGDLGPTKGMVRREEVAPTLSAEFLEFREDVLTQAITGAEVTTTGGTVTGIQEITGGAIASGDYINNVVYIGKRSDGQPVIFEIENVLPDADFSFSSSDGDEGVVPITFNAHFNIDDATTDSYGAPIWQEPWRLYIAAETA